MALAGGSPGHSASSRAASGTTRCGTRARRASRVRCGAPVIATVRPSTDATTGPSSDTPMFSPTWAFCVQQGPSRGRAMRGAHRAGHGFHRTGRPRHHPDHLGPPRRRDVPGRGPAGRRGRRRVAGRVPLRHRRRARHRRSRRAGRPTASAASAGGRRRPPWPCSAWATTACSDLGDGTLADLDPGPQVARIVALIDEVEPDTHRHVRARRRHLPPRPRGRLALDHRRRGSGPAGGPGCSTPPPPPSTSSGGAACTSAGAST